VAEAVVGEDRRYPARPMVGASAAVVRDGRVLVAARAAMPGRGVYTLPGGLVEAGESLAEAALRELREEVGVEGAILGALPAIEIIDRDREGRARHHFVVHPHAARWVAGEPAPGPEALDVRWVTPAEAEHLRTTPGLPGVIAAALALAEGTA
jgi:8-oxo-dGTP diphosphatase